MVMDVIDHRTQSIVGESRLTGKRVSNFGVVAQNSRTRCVDQGLGKEVRCRILDLRRGGKSGGDFVQQRVWGCESRYKVERTTDSIRQCKLCQIVRLQNEVTVRQQLVWVVLCETKPGRRIGGEERKITLFRGSSFRAPVPNLVEFYLLGEMMGANHEPPLTVVGDCVPGFSPIR